MLVKKKIWADDISREDRESVVEIVDMLVEFGSVRVEQSALQQYSDGDKIDVHCRRGLYPVLNVDSFGKTISAAKEPNFKKSFEFLLKQIEENKRQALITGPPGTGIQMK